MRYGYISDHHDEEQGNLEKTEIDKIFISKSYHTSELQRLGFKSAFKPIQNAKQQQQPGLDHQLLTYS